MRKFISALPTKKVSFMDGEIEIRKLSAGSVKRIGKVSQNLDTSKDEDSLVILQAILAEGVVLEEGEEPITTDILEEFPLDSLSSLSNDIMVYAGVVDNQGNAG